MTVRSLNTYAQAVQSGYPFWRLEIDNWGNRQTGADATSLVYPANGNNMGPINIPGGAQLIAIGPDSTADQLIVDYNQILTPGTFTPPNPGNLNQQSMTIGVNRPGIQVPGPMIFRTSYSTMYGDIYIRDGIPGNVPLGTNPVFESPSLQVFTYTRVPPAIPPLKRVDMYRSINTIIEDQGGEEEVLAIWPVMGRKWIGIYVRASGTLQADIRMGRVTDYVNTAAGPVAQFRPVEKTVVTASVSGSGATQSCMATSKPCQFITLNAIWQSGVGGIVATMIASDDPAGETPGSV